MRDRLKDDNRNSRHDLVFHRVPVLKRIGSIRLLIIKVTLTLVSDVFRMVWQYPDIAVQCTCLPNPQMCCDRTDGSLYAIGAKFAL